MALPVLVETVDVRLLANLSDNFRSPYEAILELTDNALASRRSGRPVRVTITGSGGVGGTLRLVAKGGRGMGVEELAEFLRGARHRPRSASTDTGKEARQRSATSATA